MNGIAVVEASPGDSAAVIEVAVAARLFPANETGVLEEMLDDHFGRNVRKGRLALLREDDVPIAVAYYEPARAAEGAWYLTMIAVRSERQSEGLGGTLLSVVEERLQSVDGRLLMVETSSLPYFERARRFYGRHGYREEARIRNYWAPGDDCIVFCKDLRFSR